MPLHISIDPNNYSYNGAKYSQDEQDLISNFLFSSSSSPEIPITESSSTAPILFLMGFGYSGTGAIHDHLKDSFPLVDAFHGRELDLFKAHPSVLDLYDLSIANQLSQHDIEKFLYFHVYGPDVIPDNESIMFTKKQLARRQPQKTLLNSILAYSKSTRFSLLRNVATLVFTLRNLHYSSVQKKQLESIISTFLVDLSYSLSDSNHIFVINNWLPAQHLSYRSLFPLHSLLLVSNRSSVDAYSSCISESSRSSPMRVIAPAWLALFLYAVFAVYVLFLVCVPHPWFSSLILNIIYPLLALEIALFRLLCHSFSSKIFHCVSPVLFQSPT